MVPGPTPSTPATATPCTPRPPPATSPNHPHTLARGHWSATGGGPHPPANADSQNATRHPSQHSTPRQGAARHPRGTPDPTDGGPPTVAAPYQAAHHALTDGPTRQPTRAALCPTMSDAKHTTTTP